MFSICFKNRAVYEIIWKNIVQPDRPQVAIWRLRISCWIPKATNTHSQYVTYCSSTTKMVARTLVFITLYVHFNLTIIIPMCLKTGYNELHQSNTPYIFYLLSLHGRHVSTSSRSSSGHNLRIQTLHKFTHKMQIGIPNCIS